MSVTNYNRFKGHSVFGLIGTGNGIEFITRLSQQRRYVAVTATQLVLIWDTKTQLQVIIVLIVVVLINNFYSYYLLMYIIYNVINSF